MTECSLYEWRISLPWQAPSVTHEFSRITEVTYIQQIRSAQPVKTVELGDYAPPGHPCCVLVVPTPWRDTPTQERVGPRPGPGAHQSLAGCATACGVRHPGAH